MPDGSRPTLSAGSPRFPLSEGAYARRVLPVDFTARRLELSDAPFPDGPDVDAAWAIVHAAEAGVGDGASTPRETVRAMLTSPDTLADETLLVDDAQGRPAGLVWLELEAEAGHTFIDAYARPDHARHLYPALLDLGMTAARRTAPRAEWKVEAAAFAGDAPLRSALAAAGFTEIRRFWRMRVDFDDINVDGIGSAAVPTGNEVPPGVTRRTVDGDSDRRLMHELFEGSFADHFGFAHRRYEDWIGWLDARQDSRPDLWWIAELDGAPVGLCLTDDSRVEEGLAYIRTLGVLPAARGRGIARWLLTEAFAQARAEGRTGAALAVDSENVTGATRLYESVGMRQAQVIDVFGRPA